VWRDDAPFMRALLRSRPRLDLTAHGETPLFYAARLRRLATLRLLLAAGADPSIADPQGRDAVAIARARRLSPALIARLEAARDRLAAGKAAQPPSAASRSTRRLPPGRGS
jgi:ankyrin repeat protein